MPNFLTTKEAAAAANCSELTIKRAIQSGQLRAYRPGRGYSIGPVDLENYVRSKRVKPAKQKVAN